MTRFDKAIVSAASICCSAPAWAAVHAVPTPQTDIGIGAVVLLAAGYIWMRRKAKSLRA